MDGFSKSQTAGQLMLQRISQNDNTQPDYPAQSIFHKPESREEYDWHTEINRGQVESAFHTLQHIRKITKSNFRLYWIGIQVRHFAKSDGTLGQAFGVRLFTVVILGDIYNLRIWNLILGIYLFQEEIKLSTYMFPVEFYSGNFSWQDF